MVHLQRGQAQGPLIHPTPPLVPTGRGRRNSLRFREAGWSHPNEDKHKAPSSTLPRPLSLQDAGDASVPMVQLPHSVVKIHQDGGNAHYPIRSSKFIRTGATLITLFSRQNSSDTPELFYRLLGGSNCALRFSRNARIPSCASGVCDAAAITSIA